MTSGALIFVTYLWHYLVARTAYDELLRPVMHGNFGEIMRIAGVGAAGFLIGLVAGRRRAGEPRHPASRERA